MLNVIAGLSSSAFISHVIHRVIAIILNGYGLYVMPRCPSVFGGGSHGGDRNLNFCRSDVTYRNSSIRASDSPRHDLRPIENGMNSFGIVIRPSFKKRDGSKTSGREKISGSFRIELRLTKTVESFGIKKSLNMTSR